jgi:hypothetical protein
MISRVCLFKWLVKDKSTENHAETPKNAFKGLKFQSLLTGADGIMNARRMAWELHQYQCRKD